MTISVPNRVCDLPMYVAGQQMSEVAREFSIAPTDVIELASDHNSLSINEDSTTPIASLIDDAARYPDPNGLGESPGNAQTEYPLIKPIGFVSESRTGSMIMKRGADTLKGVQFELGVKNPAIVFADADLERTADATFFMIYSLNDDCRISSSHLLVEVIYNKFTDLVAEKASRIKVRHPFHPESVVEPLIHRIHKREVLEHIETSIANRRPKAANRNVINGIRHG